ncbi:rhombotarget lipoprotein [Candidatus Halobeggiatoa sp. HSG11]|nr:rhombotarget lipoprotein [Candidatus Halobeggiatoa sp. HSG11]
MKTLKIVFISVIIVLASCSLSKSKHYSSSTVQYLYPDKKTIETPKIPSLALPLRVGAAFVPGRNIYLTERDKIDLMQKVSKNFQQYDDFVKSIEIIPSAYLIKKGSFANLDQISAMYNIDVIALISYDQTRFTDSSLASVTYWTIVGAYVVQGERNETHTMVDAAIYDIKSRKMLFRAPGISHIKSRATLVNLSEQVRLDSIEGFKMASQDLVVNLKEQLKLFQEKVEDMPQDYKIINKSN